MLQNASSAGDLAIAIVVKQTCRRDTETMHMIKKGQLDVPEAQALSAADQFYSLAV